MQRQARRRFAGCLFLLHNFHGSEGFQIGSGVVGMWEMRKITRVTVVLVSVFVLAGSILAHSAHRVHTHKQEKAVADVTDAYTPRATSSAALTTTRFTLPPPSYIPGLLLATEAVPSINSARPGVPTSRAPPRQS